MTKLIMTLEKTETSPEMVRVIFDNDYYLVQTLNRANKWITHAEHKIKKAALTDAINWYA